MLREARNQMLRLHKILLDMERAEYEQEAGPQTSGELLQLVINHPQFAWLRKISALVVEIDESLDGKEPASAEELQVLSEQARGLFTAPSDEGFRERYQSALQRNPDAVLAHAEVARVLRGKDPLL